MVCLVLCLKNSPSTAQPQPQRRGWGRPHRREDTFERDLKEEELVWQVVGKVGKEEASQGEALTSAKHLAGGDSESQVRPRAATTGLPRLGRMTALPGASVSLCEKGVWSPHCVH